MGALRDAEQKYFKGRSPGWSDMMRHGTYDAFWQARTILPHITGITPAVLVVGGLYDPNNYYGALELFKAIGRQSPSTDHAIVIGPWLHGQWARDSARFAGELQFGQRTADFYQQEIVLPFFEATLKGEGRWTHPKAWVFETGRNRWRTFDQWPPAGGEERSLYLGAGRTLTLASDTLTSDTPAEARQRGFDEWVTDPDNPVPFVATGGMDMSPTTWGATSASARPAPMWWRIAGPPSPTTSPLSGPSAPRCMSPPRAPTGTGW
jgi:hypothetical protein